MYIKLYIYLLQYYRRFDEGNEETENISPNITNLDRNIIDSCKNNNSYDINEATINSAQTHPLINYEPTTSQETTRNDITNYNNVVSKQICIGLISLFLFKIFLLFI